jgi:beta-fructofuranosidase
MVVAGSWEKTAGVALYEATDETLLHWRYCGLLYQTTRDKARLLECPNFVKLNDQWILLTSPFRPIEYITGDFDLTTLTFTPQHEGILDAGHSTDHDNVPNYYASNLLFAPDGRCILLGWVRGFPAGRGWNGALALPRVLTIAADGQPRQQPIAELQTLRGRLVNLVAHQPATTIEHTFATDAFEIVGQVRLSEAAEVDLRLNGHPLLHYGAGTITLAGVTVALPLGGEGRLTLHLFVDRSVVELFANDGQVAMTRLIDAPGADCVVTVASSGEHVVIEQLSAWELQPVRRTLVGAA